MNFYIRKYAVCPGGEGAVLKTVGLNRLAGSNPVHGVLCTIGVMAASRPSKAVVRVRIPYGALCCHG